MVNINITITNSKSLRTIHCATPYLTDALGTGKLTAPNTGTLKQ